jgi:uncharacterized protein YgiM (DUF1202 family)
VWLFLAVMVSTSLLAQPVTNPPPAAPIAPASNAPAAAATTSAAPLTNVAAPTTATPASTNNSKAKAETTKPKAKKSEKKSVAKKKESTPEPVTTPLVVGKASVIASNVNVRGQAKLKSEVIGKLQRGDTVDVLQEILLKKSEPNEPSAWAKIILPASTHVWVHSSFVSSNKTVIPKKLKLRGGPGEEYSMLGIIKRGDELKEVGTKGDWMEIEAPPEACGFVAARYLKQEPAPVETTEPPPTTTVVTENPPVTPATNETPATASTTETNATPPAKPVIEEPPPRRIVDREGFVRGTFSIQAPTKYELVSPETGKVVNYLYTTSSRLDLGQYKGMRIVVTGEEGLDERWRNTPVITIQKLVVLE